MRLTRIHVDALPAELHPAQQRLQRLPGDAACDETLQLGIRRRGLGQQAGLVLGEDASRRPQARDESGIRFRHPAMVAVVDAARGAGQYGRVTSSRARCAALFATVALVRATASGVSSRSL